MRSFKQYLSEKYDEKGHLISTPEKSVKALHKTLKTIDNHRARGGEGHHLRGQDLISKYNEHAEFLKDNHPDHWKKYAKDVHKSEHHDGSDLYA